MTLTPGTRQSGPTPPRQGLYDPAFEHDACGVAFVATLSGRPSHSIVAQGLEALRNLDHRGATGADPRTGDGAGILMQVPDAFLRAEAGFDLPRAGAYAVGNAFLPTEACAAETARATIEKIADEENLQVLGWRTVPTDDTSLSDVTRANMPFFQQLFVAAKGQPMQGLALERRAYCLRRRAQHEAGVYFASLSCRTLVYKGMLTTDQLPAFFPDLRDERIESAIALVHSRFSTNTFPSWPLAHPYRYIAHNGEINTVRGNANWMTAREARFEAEAFGDDIRKIRPIINPNG
ncbi:MAG TPA: glutamate synthase subunit alpha, partial [Microlunatus sp.]|nr:glutamate synthase subunit alpha [Microlunatus sp.]